MPRSTHNPIGVPAGLAQQLSERKTRIQPPAAFAVEGFGPRDPGSAGAWPEPEIWQWLIAKLSWGHTTRLLAWVKGRHGGPGRDSGANL